MKPKAKIQKSKIPTKPNGDALPVAVTVGRASEPIPMDTPEFDCDQYTERMVYQKVKSFFTRDLEFRLAETSTGTKFVALQHKAGLTKRETTTLFIWHEDLFPRNKREAMLLGNAIKEGVKIGVTNGIKMLNRKISGILDCWPK